MRKLVLMIVLIMVSFSACKALKKKKCDCPDHRRKKGVALNSTWSDDKNNFLQIKGIQYLSLTS